jgi:hypothetical protein
MTRCSHGRRRRRCHSNVRRRRRAGQCSCGCRGAQLEEAPLELYGLCVLDRAAVLEAADAIEIGRSGTPGGLGMGGGKQNKA